MASGTSKHSGSVAVRYLDQFLHLFATTNSQPIPACTGTLFSEIRLSPATSIPCASCARFGAQHHTCALDAVGHAARLAVGGLDPREAVAALGIRRQFWRVDVFFASGKFEGLMKKDVESWAMTTTTLTWVRNYKYTWISPVHQALQGHTAVMCICCTWVLTRYVVSLVVGDRCSPFFIL